VDEYITHGGYKLEDINDAVDAMHVNGSLLVSGFCLTTVFSRNPIASVLSSTCHNFRKKGGEKNIVVLSIEYECSSSMVSNSSRTRNVVVVRQYNVPPRLMEFIISNGRVV
jgi:hypothetical protein